MTAASAATQLSALERYKSLKERGAKTLEILNLVVETEGPEVRNALAYRGPLSQHIKNLELLRDVLVERLNEGQAKIYTKRTIDTPSPATAEMEEKWVLLLEEYRTITDELHSLAPQMAVEAYAQSLKAAVPAKSNGARPNNSQKPYGIRH